MLIRGREDTGKASWWGRGGGVGAGIMVEAISTLYAELEPQPSMSKNRTGA